MLGHINVSGMTVAEEGEAMDRFEAIEVLKDFLEGDTCRGNEIIETPHEDAGLKMAIEALEIGSPDEFRKLKEAKNNDVKERIEERIGKLKACSDYPHNFKGQMVEDFEWVLGLLNSQS